MHELSLVESIITIVEEERERHGIPRLKRVYVKNGALAGAVTEALTFAWEALTPGTDLAGVELVVEDVPLVVRCGGCGTEFSPEDRRFMPCPNCEEFFGHTVLAGKELSVASIEPADDE